MASLNDPAKVDGTSSEDDDDNAILRTVGDLTIDTTTNVPTAVTVASGVVAVTLAIETSAGGVSVSLSASDAERLGETLATRAAKLDEAGADRGAEWLQEYRSETCQANQ